MLLIIIISFIITICLMFLFFIAPNNRHDNRAMTDFECRPIAHRGLFDNQKDYPENTKKAFLRAVENGYGIELDVQMTTDNQLVVFHDESLIRMCGINKNLTDCVFNELQKYKVGNSEESIPLFSDVLNLIGGKVPLIVEIKSEGDWKTTTQLTAKMLDQYHGIYCVESFNPFVIQWFKKNRPSVIRGQLSSNFFKDDSKMKFVKKLLLSNLILNVFSRPDFIAYNHKFSNHFGYLICRTLFHPINVAWTIKNRKEYCNAQKVFSVYIFDSFIIKSEEDSDFYKSEINSDSYIL